MDVQAKVIEVDFRGRRGVLAALESGEEGHGSGAEVIQFPIQRPRFELDWSVFQADTAEEEATVLGLLSELAMSAGAWEEAAFFDQEAASTGVPPKEITQNLPWMDGNDI